MKYLLLLTVLLSFNATAFSGIDTVVTTFTKEAASIRVVVTSDSNRVERMITGASHEKGLARRAIHIAVANSTIDNRVKMSFDIANELYRVGILINTVTIEFNGIVSTASIELNPNFKSTTVDIP